MRRYDPMETAGVESLLLEVEARLAAADRVGTIDYDHRSLGCEAFIGAVHRSDHASLTGNAQPAA